MVQVAVIGNRFAHQVMANLVREALLMSQAGRYKQHPVLLNVYHMLCGMVHLSTSPVTVLGFMGRGFFSCRHNADTNSVFEPFKGRFVDEAHDKLELARLSVFMSHSCAGSKGSGCRHKK